MKAMIFAAGLGTRLRPITNNIPKALVRVNGVPLLEFAINRLKKAGVAEIIINVHHHASQVIDFLKANRYFDIRIEISDEREFLLDTGGGIKKAAWFFDDGKPFFIYNVDILSGTNLRALYDHHLQNEGLATLLVKHRKGNRYFLFDDKMRLCGWTNTSTGESIMAYEPSVKPALLAFSSIHMADPAIFDLMEETGAFSIRDFYLRIASQNPIFGYLDDETPWIDVGTPERLKQAGEVLKKML